MAAGATIRTLNISLSDVDRAMYETFELRLAQHPSESLPYFWCRVLAYGLSYRDGIRFSKGGLSNAEEAPLAVWNDDGTMVTWIDIGAPSAERLHKASKAADNVELYSSVRLDLLQKEANKKRVHQLDQIVVWCLAPDMLDALAALAARQMTLELVRTEGQLYATVNGSVVEGQVKRESLTEST
jgi:uncharacterized protein YaeQ